ncbi:hypothetical protein PUN28_001756 [Cardiocondyla obscurior]|uniref:Uncharacterized protein n=1 Tax=Cardiocondyla obscurior TaxID=286306 RepID=A0AAW2GR41_9HYME
MCKCVSMVCEYVVQADEIGASSSSLDHYVARLSNATDQMQCDCLTPISSLGLKIIRGNSQVSKASILNNSSERIYGANAADDQERITIGQSDRSPEIGKSLGD